MKNTIVFFLTAAVVVLGLTSCNKPIKKDNLKEEKISLDVTVGEMARFAGANPIPIRGYGIVAGLWGTGSSECPSDLRPRLEKYVWQQMKGAKYGEIAQFIKSMDTAVVEISGAIPPLSVNRDRFDIEIKPLSQTQTTSLRGGTLYTAELKELSRMSGYDQYTKTIGSAAGQIFTCQDKTTGQPRYFVLGGGTNFLNTAISMILNQPNYFAAKAIRDRINERFGSNTANAVSAAEINVSIPPSYSDYKSQFLSMIQMLYLSEDETLRTRRIKTLSDLLPDPQQAYAAEIALEAIGKPALPQLAELLLHKDPTVRFYAARCMLNIGDNRGINVIRQIANNFKSPHQIAAIESLSRAKLKDAEPILAKLVTSDNLEVRICAYEQMLNLNSIMVKRIPVWEDFFIDLINCTGPKIIYAYRKDNARIAIFGSPLNIRKNLFIDMDQILINSQPEDKYISISRRHPTRAKLIGPLKCSYSVEDIIRTLGYPPEIDTKKTPWPGLGISYSEILPVLEKMCLENMVPAKYCAGPLINIDSLFEQIPPTTDNKEQKNIEELKNTKKQ